MSADNPACDATCPNYCESHTRVLELELEVKRLREALEPQTGTYSDPDYDLRRAEIARQALSTPPPTLASAYVRLRDAAHTVTHFESSNKMAAQLAEIARLENGE